MDRERLAATAPSWLAIEALSAQTKLDMLTLWIEAVIDAI